jgi:hypothetical protein
LQDALSADGVRPYEAIGRLMQHDVDHIFAIDLDHCIDENGVLNEYARDLVDRANSYAEVTPSGRGIRIYGRAQVPHGLLGRSSIKVWQQGTHPAWPEIEVQLFLRGSYVTLSGKRIEGTPTEIADNHEFLNYLLSQNRSRLGKYVADEQEKGVVAIRGQANVRRPLEPSNEVTGPVALANPKRVRYLLAWMNRTNKIFTKNWNRLIDRPDNQIPNFSSI